MANSKHERDRSRETGEPRQGRGLRRLAMLTLVVVSLAIYANDLHGPFVFDDLYSIRENPNIRSLTPLSESLSGPEGSGSSGRPLVALSLAVNYSIGGLEVFGYHLFNVLVHALAALALFGLVRRCLGVTALRARALPLAFATALLWTVHPLHTDALNHVVYRNEAMGALFYLLTLYCAVRGFGNERRNRWYAGSAIACALAMASKETAVTAPLAVLALDRTLFSPGFLPALRRRWPLYLSLAATWIVLVLSVLSGDRGTSTGFDQEVVTSLEYLRTQVTAIAQYLRLAIWPDELVFDYYHWPIVRSWGEVWLRGVFLAALLGASVWAFSRRRVVGYLGLLFFAILAPSSSVIPLSGEMIAEHRMYMPLAVVVLLAVLAADFLLARVMERRKSLAVGAAIALLAGGALAWRTVRRNVDYRSAPILWGTLLERYPEHARAHQMLGEHYIFEEEFEAALPHCREAVRLDARLKNAEFNLGVALMETGRPDEALAYLEHAVREKPDSPDAHGQLGVCLGRLNQPERAEASLRQAMSLDRENPVILHNLAAFLIRRGGYAEAAELARRAVELDSEYVAAEADLGAALVNQGRPAQAVPHLRRAIELEPGVGRRHFALAMALERAGWPREAIPEYVEANRLDPGTGAAFRIVHLLAASPDPAARNGAAALQWAQGLVAGAPREDPRLLDLLSMAQAELGQFDRALESARRALALAEASSSTAHAQEIRRRIALYEKGRPYRIEEP